MAVPNLLSKAGSYQDLGGGALCAPLWGMIRQKYPGAARVKLRHIQHVHFVL